MEVENTACRYDILNTISSTDLQSELPGSMIEDDVAHIVTQTNELDEMVPDVAGCIAQHLVVGFFAAQQDLAQFLWNTWKIQSL